MTAEARSELNEKVMDAYEQALAEQQDEAAEESEIGEQGIESTM